MFTVHTPTGEEISRHSCPVPAIEAAIGSHISLGGERVIRETDGTPVGRVTEDGFMHLAPRLQAALNWR